MGYRLNMHSLNLKLWSLTWDGYSIFTNKLENNIYKNLMGAFSPTDIGNYTQDN
jgi:hypothetical protein